MSATETKPSAAAAAPDEAEGAAGPGFWIGAALGAAIVAFGIHGLWVNERRGFPSAARWFVGGAVAFDVVLIPLGAAIGWLAKRASPTWAWPVLRAALLTSVLLAAFAAPLVLGEGGVPGNPTVRPRNYAVGLGWALGLTWLVAAGALAARGARRPGTGGRRVTSADGHPGPTGG